MMVLLRHLVAGVLAVCLLGLGSCGAGLIGGIASSGSGSDAGGRAPQLNVTNNTELPLVPAPGDVRTIILNDAQLAGTALAVHVVLDPDDLDEQPAVQLNPTARVQGTSSVITFELDMTEINTRVTSTHAADIPAFLVVKVANREAAPPVGITLVRQPLARLVLGPNTDEAVLSPAGDQVRIEVDGLRSTDASGIQVLVTTRDPQSTTPGARVTRLASDVAIVTLPSGVPTIDVTIPGTQSPDQITLQVIDAIAGQSPEINNLYYRPEIVLALPGQGPTTGGSLLTLIGTAMVPFDFSVGPAAYDFDKVTLTLQKGERTIELPRADFREAESGSDRLVFTMPPSPDGRPGLVDIVLKLELDGFDVEVTAKLFLFANPDPFYGPRGAILDQPPVAAAPIKLDNAPSVAEAPDFAILTEQGEVGYVQLLLALQNGMFQPFAAPRKIGDHEVLAEHSPSDLLVGDFDGDSIPDLFVVNEGGGGQARHHVILGQARPAPPLGDVFAFPATAGSSRGRVGHFDGDNLVDVLLVPGPGAPPETLPEVWLSRPTVTGEPHFVSAGFLNIGEFDYEAVEVADFNRDGALDVAMATGSEGKSAMFSLVEGDGTGSFTKSIPVEIAVPGYIATPETRAVGLHACQDGGPSGTTHQSIAIVLSGDDVGASPTVAVLAFDVDAGEYVTAVPSKAIYQAPEGIEPFGLSMAANLDEDAAGLLELVVTIRGEPTVVSSGLLQFTGTRFKALAGAIENGTAGGTEVPVLMRSLAFATAFPAGQLGPEAKAVFIVHEVDVDGARERRLSTRLVTVAAPDEPRLLPPDAGAAVPLNIESIVGGNFSQQSVLAEGRARDLALASRATTNGDAITVIINDGFGGFPGFGRTLAYPGLVPKSLVVVPDPMGDLDTMVFASAESRIGVWRHKFNGIPVQAVDVESEPLRDLDPLLAGHTLDDATELKVADIDGDGISDLIVHLSFSSGPGAGNSWVALMRGKGSVPVNEFPFHMPTRLLQLGRTATSLVIGDFAPHAGSALEIALAVPSATAGGLNGNHVVFCRYDAGASPEDDAFVVSADANGPQVLLAGSGPQLLQASDFDGDGLVDLLVACSSDRSLRLFRNTSAPGGQAFEVDVGAFVEAFGSPSELATGLPTTLRLGDVNGDGNLDAVVATEFSGVTGVSTTVATYLSSGTGEFSDARFASATRLGLFEERLSLDLGDWNRDDVPDLFLGWAVQGTSIVNLRVLFGGTR